MRWMPVRMECGTLAISMITCNHALLGCVKNIKARDENGIVL